EGRLPETFGWRSGVRLPRAGLVTLHSGDPGLGPPAESRLIRRRKCPLESAARAEKSRGGAPKGAPASVIGRLISGPIAGDRPDREAGHGCGVPRPAPVGALPPSTCEGMTKRERAKPGAQKSKPPGRGALAT